MVWKCIESSNFHFNFIAAFERINYDILMHKIDKCAQELTELYCKAFDAISKDIRAKTDNSSSNDPVDAPGLSNRFGNRLTEEMMTHLQKLDADVTALLEYERFSKWSTDQLSRWTHYKEDQAAHWRRLMDGLVENIFRYESIVEGYKKELRDRANRMFGNGEFKNSSSQEKRRLFDNLFNELVDEANKKYPPFYKEVGGLVDQVFARNKDLVSMMNPTAGSTWGEISKMVYWQDSSKLYELQRSIERDVKKILKGVTQYSDGIVVKCIQMTKFAFVDAESRMRVSGEMKQQVLTSVAKLIRTDLRATQELWDRENCVAARFETCRPQMESYFENLSRGWAGMVLLKANICDWLSKNLQKSFEEELTAIVGTTLKGKRWVASADVMQALVDNDLVQLLPNDVNTALQKISDPGRHIEDVVFQRIADEVNRCIADKREEFKTALKKSIDAAASTAAGEEKYRAMTFLATLKSQIREYLGTRVTNSLLTTMPDASDPNYNCDEQSADVFMPENKYFVCFAMLAVIDGMTARHVDVTKGVLAYIKDRARGSTRGVMPRCGELCPICKSLCTRELGHVTKEEEKRHDSYHQPVGLVGVGTNRLIPGSCSFNAKNGWKFKHSDGEWHKYSDFDKVFPSWSLPVEKEPLLLREHIFYNYQNELASFFSLKKCTEIPPSYNHPMSDIKQHISTINDGVQGLSMVMRKALPSQPEFFTEVEKVRKAFPSQPQFPMHGLPSNPLSQKILTHLASRAQRMPENEMFICHLIKRLQYLHDQVATLAVYDHVKLKYVEVVGQLVNLTRRKPLLLRLASENMVTTIRELHLKLGKIGRSFGLDDEPAVIKWEEEWDTNQGKHFRLISKLITEVSERMLVGEFQHESNAEEALMALQSSINREGYPSGMSALKQSTVDRIKRYLHLHSLLVYDLFIPSMDIVTENDPFRFGGYDEMRRGTWLCNGERREVAIQLFRGELGDARANREFINRLEWQSRIPENDHILKVYGGSHLGAPPFYVYEKVPFGTLIEFLSDVRNGTMFWRLFEQAAECLKFLHENEIVHGNLRCSNIVIGENSTVKLVDVGPLWNNPDFGIMPLERDHVRSVDRWKPVEQFDDQADDAGAGYEGDIYSLAMCMIEAITLDVPFGFCLDDETVKMLILTEDEGHPRPDGVSDDEWALINDMRNPDSNQRPSIDDVIRRTRELARDMEDQVETKTTAKTRAETPRVCACCGNNASSTRDTYCRWCGHITQLNAVPSDLERPFADFLSKREKFISRHGLPAYLKSCPAIDVRRKLYEVAIAVQDLHLENIPHCDLRPANIFIGRDGKAHLSFEHNNLAAKFEEHRLPIPSKEAFRWQPREVLNGDQPTVMSDVYALGMCAIFIVSGNPPWGNELSEEDVKFQVCNRRTMPPRCQGLFTNDEWNLIVRMCDLHPENRIGLDDVILRLADIIGSEHTQESPEWQLNDSDVFFDDALVSQTLYASRHIGRWKDAVVAVETVTELFKRENKSFTNVADLWFSLKHPTILQLFGACRDLCQRHAFVCEYAECGDLRSFIFGGNLATARSQISQILLDVALGIRYLHAIGIVHGDVGLHNIFVKRSGQGKLAGFSLCSQVSHMCQNPSESEPKRPCEATLGTIDAGFASDVNCFGRCIVNAFSVNLNTIETRTNESGDMQRPEVLSEGEWALVKDMCCRDPLRRIEMPEVVDRLARLGAVNAAIDSQLLETNTLLSVNERNTLQAMVLEDVLNDEEEEKKETAAEAALEAERDEIGNILDDGNYDRWAGGMQRKEVVQQSLCSSLCDNAAWTILTSDLHSQLKNYRPSVKVTPEVSGTHFVSPQHRTPRWRLPHASILEAKPIKVLGKGAFASVSHGMWLGASIALNKMSKVDLDHDQALRQETNVWFKLRHPHIVSLFGVCCGGYQLFVCDLVDGGHLTDYCSNQEGKPKEKVWGLLHDAAVGLQGLHSYDIIHADLKCDNILITKDGRAKLIDFGLSCLCTCDGGETQGAPWWKAPECLDGAGSTFASDVFSFGMCIIQAMTGDFPWGTLDDIVVKRHVKNRSLPKQPKSMSTLEWGLVKRMCCFNPDDRLQVDEVVKVVGFFARRNPYVIDQNIKKTLRMWET